jgi:hypothetical protein
MHQSEHVWLLGHRFRLIEKTDYKCKRNPNHPRVRGAMDAIAGCAERPAMLYSPYTPSTWMASDLRRLSFKHHEQLWVRASRDPMRRL